MYIPTRFRQDDQTALHDFIRTHSFATLVSWIGDEPQVTHLPLLLDSHVGSHGKLIGHMARANPHWQHAAGERSLAIFHGPHAYVSPGWIDEENFVPTWNYVTVHAQGILKILDDRDALHDTLSQMVTFYESNRETPWSMAKLSQDYLDRMLAAIVGIEIQIEQLEGKWKLSQNYSADIRKQMVDGLVRTVGYEEQEVAKWMRASL